MKRLSIFVLITSAVTIFCLSSCTKDELVNPVVNPGNDNFINTAPAGYAIYLVANQWSKIVTGVYTCDLPNIIPPGYRNNRKVKIYLKANQEILINDPIDFMDGKLSATTTGISVAIIYRCYGELPFDHLDIKVVIE